MAENNKEKILDGKAASAALKESLKPRIDRLRDIGIIPGLATILVGEDPASKIYVNLKHKDCADIGIKSFQEVLPETTSRAELEAVITRLNNNDEVHGILLQVPLPPNLDAEDVLRMIDPRKDVDGFHPQNLGNLLRGNLDDAFVSCTPAGIMYLLRDHYHILLEGLETVIVNRSNIVGKPLIPLLLRENATVTTCHTRTRDLKFHTTRADLVIIGVGKPKMFTKDYFKEGVIIVDVGINRTDEGLCGDVDFADVLEICSKITPVPGGIGPMTRAALMLNTVKSAERFSRRY
ncbi:MAG: bifunctional 5,10-methylenetetrahydrofolate dehydrogenase/5,10-methenyltetrahydrofolate cyclohydrolase [Promethearchaeota archaeon]